MNAISASRGIRRNRLPGTRKPFKRPLSKQRMIVCCETLQISAASPVVNTVFMVLTLNTRVPGKEQRPKEQLPGYPISRPARTQSRGSLNPDRQAPRNRVSGLIHLSYLTIGHLLWQLEWVAAEKPHLRKTPERRIPPQPL